VVRNQHFLLVTLVLCNAACTEVRAQRRARRRAAAVTCAQLAAPRCTPPVGGAAERPAAVLTPPPGAQTLPLVLDRLADPITAVLLSITVVLIFGAPPRPGLLVLAALQPPGSAAAARPARPELSRALPERAGGAARARAARAGEIIPQAVCTRYGLAVGAYSAWVVQALMVLTSPLSYPLARLLDWVLGSEQSVRRAAAAPPGGQGR